MKITVSQGKDIEIASESPVCDCGANINVHHGFGRYPYSMNCEGCGLYFDNYITCCTPDEAIYHFKIYLADNSKNKFKFKKVNFSRPITNKLNEE